MSNLADRYEQSHFFEFEESDQDTSERSTQYKTYLPDTKQNFASVKYKSNIYDGSLLTPLRNHEISSSPAEFDDLVELLRVSSDYQSTAPNRKSHCIASFDAANRVTPCHKLLVFAKRFDLFIRFVFFRRKRRYSFDMSSSDFGSELSFENNKKKRSTLKSRLSPAKIVQKEGVKSTALLVLLLCTLFFLWLQIMKTGFPRVDSRNTFRSKGIQRIVLPIHSIPKKKIVDEDANLVSSNGRPETEPAMQVDLHDHLVGYNSSRTKPKVLLLEKQRSEETQDKKRKGEENLTVDNLAPVDVLPSLTTAELKEEYAISLPPSFEYLADFPSARQPGDIPVVSFFVIALDFSPLHNKFWFRNHSSGNKIIVLAHSKIRRIFNKGYFRRLLSNDSSRRNGNYLKPNS